MYNLLKIIHILSAVCFLTSMVYCVYLWLSQRNPRFISIIFQRIQTHTWQIIVPFIVVQLLTGFTLFSLQPQKFPEGWGKTVAIHFIVVIASWLGFVYLLLMSYKQKLLLNRHSSYRRWQGFLLVIGGLALFEMVFRMASVD